MISPRRIIAYQLSLFGWTPKICFAWRRPFFQWRFMGTPVPLSADEIRQNKLLRSDSMPEATA